MRRPCLNFAGIPVIVAAVLAAGCAAQFPVTQMTPPEDTVIAINDPALKDKATARVSYTGPFEHVEYARFEGGGLTLEAVYNVAIGDNAVLAYHYSMARMRDTWKFNTGKAAWTGAANSVRGWHGGIDYRPYTLADANRGCAAFSGDWNVSGRDPFGRPKQVFFGYVCAPPGGPLAAERVEALLKSVRVDQRHGHTFVKPGMRAKLDAQALAIATGSARPGTGNSQFPFHFGTTFQEGGDDFGD